MYPEIEKEGKQFRKELHILQSEIAEFMYDISNALDYDDPTLKKLLAVYSTIKRLKKG